MDYHRAANEYASSVLYKSKEHCECIRIHKNGNVPQISIKYFQGLSKTNQREKEAWKKNKKVINPRSG